MNCSTVSVDIDSYSTNLSQSHPKARKDHRCGECRKTIVRGEVYLREVNIHDGRVITDKTCQDCVSIRNEFFREGYWYGQVIELLDEHVQESRGDISENCLVALTPGAREKVCGMIEGYWKDQDDE